MKVSSVVVNSVFILLFLLLACFWGTTLTGYTFLMAIIIGVALLPKCMENKYGEMRLHWGSILIAGTLVSLILFGKLTSPSAATFANVHHHTISVDGFITGNRVSLVNSNDRNALWQLEGECGSLVLEKHTELFSVMGENFMQPIYQSAQYDSLLNGKSLPYFLNTLSIAFKDGYKLTYDFKQSATSDVSKRDTAFINVMLQTSDSIVDYVISDFEKPIRKSLPLSALVENLKIPIPFTRDLNLLDNIVVLREIAGKADKEYRNTGFFVALNREVLNQIEEVSCDGNLLTEYPWEGKQTYTIKPDKYIKVGTGIHSTRFLKPKLVNDTGSFLEFKDKPTYYLMMDSVGKKHDLLITTDKLALAKSKVGMGLYYNLFPQSQNQNHFIATLTYVPGDTHEVLGCKLQSMTGKEATDKEGRVVRGILPGNSFVLSGGGEIMTQLTYHNQYEESPVKLLYCTLLIALVCLLGYLSLTVSSRYELKTGVECATWMLLQLLLTYRLFLAWRISVFLPVENIGTFTLQILRSGGDAVVWTFMAILTFFFVILFCKLGSCRRNGTEYSSINVFIVNHSLFFFLILVCCYVFAGFFLGKLSAELVRFSNIFFPVSIFFLCEWLLLRIQELYNEFIFKVTLLRVCNFFLCIGLLFLNDPGYGIMFFLFSLLYLSTYCFLTCQTNTYVGRRQSKIVFLVCPLLLFLTFVLGGTRVATFVFTYPLPVFIVAGAVLVGLLFYFCYKKGFFCYLFDWGYLKAHTFVFFVLMASVIIYILGSCFIGSYFQNNPHFRYRSEIHNKNVSEIMLNEEMNTRNYERLLEAAQNQWYLNYQEQKGKEIRFSTATPYRLLPHFNKGISWITQTSDAVLSRYIISEHSDITPMALMAAILIFAFGVLANYRIFTPSVMILAGCGMLLACQSMFIWMATTNRFIFFGQDFPMLSVTSKVTVFYTLFLLGLIILCSTKAENNAYSSGNNYIHYHRFAYIGFPILLLILFGWITNDVFFWKSSYDKFNIGDVIEGSRKELSLINDKLNEFQEKQMQNLIHDKVLVEESFISSFKPRLHQTNYNSFITRFSQSSVSEKVGERMSVIDWIENLVDEGKISSFTLSLYKLYLNKLSKKNSSEDIIHLRQPDGKNYQLAINNSFFMLSAPVEVGHGWKGDIVPLKDEKDRETAITLYENEQVKQKGKRSKVLTLNNESGLVVLDDFSSQLKNSMVYFCKLNEEWTPNGETCYIVGKKRKDNVKVQLLSGSEKYLIDDVNSELSTLTAYAGDYIHLPSDGQYIYINGEDCHFFMKNIWVNGKRDEYYPLGEIFFYPYNLAEVMQNGGGDLELTLSYELTQELYHILGKVNDGAFSRNVIVANGRGEIKAMVSHKFRQGYPVLLNPNDRETIKKYAEDFYLKSNPGREKKIWGEINLMLLPRGPGSTIKPIYFSAVSSQLPIDWSKFRMIIDGNSRLVKDENHCYITHYGDRVFKKPIFRSLINDEQTCGVSEFITMSSNYFNSILVHLGNYQSDQLLEAFQSLGSMQNPLFIKRGGENCFPAFSLGGDTKYVFKHWLGNDGMASHDGGILSKALELNFNLPIIGKERLSDMSFISLNPYGDEYNLKYERNQIVGVYAFPEVSMYNQEYFASDYAVNQENILFAAALGGANVVNVTPWKMLEMYGRLASRNRSYKLVMTSNHTPQYTPFVYKNNNNQTVYTDLLFEGMRNVALTGTANKLSELSKELKEEGYYLYCKTGTNSQGKDAPSNTQNQYLGVIISKGELSEVSEENIGKQKFFVLYFYTENHPHHYENIRQCINAVVNSTAFINYMK